MVNGVVVQAGNREPVFHAVRDAESTTDVRVVDGFLQRFGGISFRLDSASERVARSIGIVASAPIFITRSVLSFAQQWTKRAGSGSFLHGVWRLMRGNARMTPLVLVSHHFMNREQLESTEGQERLAHCVFKVPINGEMLSMCEVNALGVREQYYAELANAG